jgi:hypothetical protein
MLCSVVEVPVEMVQSDGVLKATSELIRSSIAPASVVWRDGSFHAPKLIPYKDNVDSSLSPVEGTVESHLSSPELLSLKGTAYRVQIDPARGIDGVHIEACVPEPLAPGEVQIDTD